MAKTESMLLLTDVVGSRSIVNRKKFERSLATALAGAEKAYPQVLDKGIKVWKGLDEAVAVVRQPERLYELMEMLNGAIAPQKMRFVVVKGEMEKPDKEGDLSTADGPVFPKAVTQMTALKKSGLLFDCNTGNEARDNLWRTQVNLLLLLQADWTEQQHRIYREYVQQGSQDGVAKVLKISQQAVSKTLKSIRAQQVRILQKNVQTWAETELTKH